ncbi:uncharacterized protein CANTADRAFT_24965 [Suhomyces tanzawaensis NRRL Y-17324]|uniref:CID domain-containing protein n=1 Tax=Suhomyces tanzawaensis NRRL Y-17324 TaxID=984487 RepID=A0A1E4SSH4_9ASCO|nr:uncharacterized protein CANTADRAFT_24965 [Suhomyces tanzawaensis NRRL Y-17324]ODV82469.1 hypothetical protein CANTADRAFT_24965 [Suhomyces tanzawaensis NRRL Y-17324]
MDSFEAATQFSQILRNLTPAVQNLTRAAHFALKHSDSEDYLFPSILDILNDPSVELNTKSTVFQFIEVLINESFYYSRQPKFNYPYIQNLKTSLPKIMLAVLPTTSNTNIYNVYTSLKNLSKHFKVDCCEFVERFNLDSLTDEDRAHIDQDIPFPEIRLEDSGEDPLVESWGLLLRKKKQSQYERLRLLKHSEVSRDTVEEQDLFSLRDKNDKAGELLSKRQIISRMEDDREAHKRSKENLWVVLRPKDVNFITEEEFLKHYWSKTHAMTKKQEDAFLETVEELNKLVAGSYKDKQF